MQKHFRLRNALFAGLLLAAFGCSSHTHPTTDFNVDSAIAYCSCQAIKTLETLPDVDSIPNTIDKGQKKWQYAHVGSWTSGFWPGTLWYLYEATQDTVWLHAAENVTRILLPEAYRKARSHDSGFIMMPSVGNAYRLTAILCTLKHCIMRQIRWPNSITPKWVPYYLGRVWSKR